MLNDVGSERNAERNALTINANETQTKRKRKAEQNALNDYW